MSCMFYFGAFLLCPPCRASVRDSRCRVLQYVHYSLIVGCLSDKSINPSKGGVAYGIKGTRCFNAMFGFYLNDL